MSTGSVPPTGSSSSGLDASTTAALNSLGSVNISQFLQMMLAEMQNQDPLNPMSNTDLMNQIGDMQQISASNQLTNTLQAMQVGQALSNATALIGATVTGTDSNGAAASGVVSQVSISSGVPSLQIGTQSVPLANVTGVLSAGNGSGSSVGRRAGRFGAGTIRRRQCRDERRDDGRQRHHTGRGSDFVADVLEDMPRLKRRGLIHDRRNHEARRAEPGVKTNHPTSATPAGRAGGAAYFVSQRTRPWA